MPGSCGKEARHKKSPFLRCFRPERPKKGDFLCRALCGEEARHKKSPFLRCFRPERPKKGDFLCRALVGKRPAQKVTFFEVLGAGKAQKR